MSLRGAPTPLPQEAVHLAQRFIGLQILGGHVAEGQPIRMAGIPDGMSCHHAGHLDDPDFNNVHFVMRWPRQG